MNKYKLSIDAFNRDHEQTISKDDIIYKLVGQKQKAENNMVDNIFENLTDKEWMYMIFNKDMIKAKTKQWTKEAEKANMTLTEYLESISPLAEGAIRNENN